MGVNPLFKTNYSDNEVTMTKIKIYGDNYDYDCRNCQEGNCEYKFMIPPFRCKNCGREISKRQYIDTEREYSFPLCHECQYEIDKRLEEDRSVSKRILSGISAAGKELVRRVSDVRHK